MQYDNNNDALLGQNYSTQIVYCYFRIIKFADIMEAGISVRLSVQSILFKRQY